MNTGKGIAALFNAHARHVTPQIVQRFRRALPDANVMVSEDLAQARRHAATIARDRPDVVFAGGGDGSCVQLLNLLREAGALPLPAVGFFRLGTGNAWARVVGATSYDDDVALLARSTGALPMRHFDLLEVEKTLCHFAGVGWDARMINDYLRNLDKRSSALIGSRLATRVHKGLTGYLYVLFRTTIPEEIAAARLYGQTRATFECLADEAYGLDADGRPVPLRGRGNGAVLYDGPASVAAAGTVEEWGFGFRAFPFAQALPGYLNARVYDRTAGEAALNMFKLWRGEHPQPGMHDYFLKRIRMRFSRPVPFQIGGDGVGLRDSAEYAVADESVDVVDWTRLRARSPAV